MLVSKSAVIQMLRVIQHFDPAGSPFVGIQWGKTTPLFHRSSATGYVESIGYRVGPPDLIVSVAHLSEVVHRFDGDGIEIYPDRNGVLTIRSVGSPTETVLCVHTLRNGVTWGTQHDAGKKTKDLDFTAFAGISTAGITMASPPVLRDGKLMLATGYGVAVRNQIPIEAYPYPRESFLRAISSLTLASMHMTDRGYWYAATESFNIVASGHRLGEEIFNLYDKGAVPVAEFPAARLVYSLGTAVAVADKGRVTFDPKLGLVVKDAYQHDGIFALGGTVGWERFVIPSGTAKLLETVLKQGSDEVAFFQRVDADTLRLVRGLWQVSFKYFAG